jgi:hypothetical protein
MNRAAMDIFEQVRCYRVELGQTLKQVMELYAVIFLNQFEMFIDQENLMEKQILELETKLKEMDTSLRAERFENEKKTQVAKQLLHSKDHEIEVLS